MRDEDRKRIFDALLGEPEKLAGMDAAARAALEDVANQELNAIEPIIDSMLSEQRREMVANIDNFFGAAEGAFGEEAEAEEWLRRVIP